MWVALGLITSSTGHQPRVSRCATIFGLHPWCRPPLAPGPWERWRQSGAPPTDLPGSARRAAPRPAAGASASTFCRPGQVGRAQLAAEVRLMGSSNQLVHSTTKRQLAYVSDWIERLREAETASRLASAGRVEHQETLDFLSGVRHNLK